jgi:hypothetical protein
MASLMNLRHTLRTRARTLSVRGALFVLGIGVSFPGDSVATPHSESENLLSVAEPYSVERYKTLWTAQLFNLPAKPEVPKVVAAPAPPPAVCKFTLQGIAEIEGTSYVYLQDKAGALHEFRLNQPVGDVEVTKITMGDQVAMHSVSLRSGSSTFVLQFDLTPDPASTVPVKKPGNPAPEAAESATEASPETLGEEIESDLSEMEEDEEWTEGSANPIPRHRRRQNSRSFSS